MLDKKNSVFITAGATGLGFEIAKTFRDNNYVVAVTDINLEALKKIEKNEKNIFPFYGDASNESEMSKITEKTLKKFGKVDVLMANAGIAGPTALCHKIKIEDWKRCIDVNLDGAFIACKLIIPSMLYNKKGVITITSSTAGLHGYPYRSPYSVAKWGMIGLMKTLAIELGSHNIRVNAICPGSVEGDRMNNVIANASKTTNIEEKIIRKGYENCVSLKRFVTAQDIAEMAFFLASNKAKNISGMSMAIDGNTEKIVD